MLVEAISHVTVMESALLRATLHAVDDARFRCDQCRVETRKAKMCTEVSPNVHFKLEEDLWFKTCPGNFFSYQALNYLEMQQAFEIGALPYPGSLSDQPNKIIEIFRIIMHHKSKVAETARKRADRDSKMRAAARG